MTLYCHPILNCANNWPNNLTHWLIEKLILLLVSGLLNRPWNRGTERETAREGITRQTSMPSADFFRVIVHCLRWRPVHPWVLSSAKAPSSPVFQWGLSLATISNLLQAHYTTEALFIFAPNAISSGAQKTQQPAPSIVLHFLWLTFCSSS